MTSFKDHTVFGVPHLYFNTHTYPQLKLHLFIIRDIKIGDPYFDT